MPTIAYVYKNFSAGSQALINQANSIIREYQAQGFDLTLRQLYYQFVSRDLLANKQTEYKRLGKVINDARMSGFIDWHAIIDRTRNRRGNQHWNSPAEIIQACARSFRYDMWATQPCRVEVWIEKDALIGVIEGACRELDVPYFACRGYSSQSEQWRAGRRFLRNSEAGQPTIILHLGDHDPSGIDMTRDNQDRLNTFSHDAAEVRRIALNMDQIDQYGPPPNPAKLTDSRASDYIAVFGRESWELDALDPSVIDQLIRDQVNDLIDWEAWVEAQDRQRKARERLVELAENWED